MIIIVIIIKRKGEKRNYLIKGSLGG